MPTYEYRCPDGHDFELFQRMSDEPVASCPECGKEAERRLSAGAGFLFKGSGFYITDYRSESYRAAEKKEKGVASAAGAGGDDSGAVSKGSATPGSGASSKDGGSGSSKAGAAKADGASKGKAAGNPSSPSSD